MFGSGSPFGSSCASSSSAFYFGPSPTPTPTTSAFGFSAYASSPSSTFGFGQSRFSNSSQSTFASSPSDSRNASLFGSFSVASSPFNGSTLYAPCPAPNVATTSHASTASLSSSVPSADAASPASATPPCNRLVTIISSSVAPSERLRVEEEEEEVPITGAPSDSTPSDQSDITKSSSPPPPPPPDSPDKVSTSRARATSPPLPPLDSLEQVSTSRARTTAPPPPPPLDFLEKVSTSRARTTSPPPPPPPPLDSLEKVSTSRARTTSPPPSDSRTRTIPVINLEVMVEKKNNRVVFAESDKDFIDLLLSFLTLSTGTIINLLEDKSPPTIIGCINNLYHSVESLDRKFFRTEACKDLLLQLRILPEIQCRSLKQMIEGSLNPAKCLYFCQNSDCRIKRKGLLSEFPTVSCHCGLVMDQLATLSEPAADDGHGRVEEDFIKGGTERFLVSSDLQITPGSTSQSIMLLKNLGIVDTNELDSRCVAMGAEEMLQLLRLSLLSKATLTHLILLKDGSTTEHGELKQKNMAESSDKRPVTNGQKNLAESANKIPVTSDSKKVSVKLFISKSRNKVLFAECGEDFVDFLFSFLTYPLGYILKLLGGKSSLGCVDNLYTSVEALSYDYMKSKEIKNMLLHPKLAPFLACDNQILQVEESSSPQYLLYIDGALNNEWFVHPLTAKFNGSSTGRGLGLLSMVNPKSSTGETTSGGGFLKGPAKFMVTDALVVTQLSPISSISFVGISGVPIPDVHEKVVVVGEEEALGLMKAALTSETVLTDVFNLVPGVSG